jgi:hypothetical protein
MDLPKSEFIKSIWPNRGLTFATACDIEGVVKKIRGAGKYEVECGHYIVTAYWRECMPNDKVELPTPEKKS